MTFCRRETEFICRGESCPEWVGCQGIKWGIEDEIPKEADI